jgi:glutathione peroxidase
MFSKISAGLSTLLSVAASFCSKGDFKSTHVSPFEIPLKTIMDAPANLKPYQGQILVVVNLASKCGFTYQYEGLEALYKKYQSKGLVILGFPSNDFLEQEPGTNEEIQNFCKVKFGVTFPLFEKAPVSGEKIQPLYSFLLAKLPETEKGAIRWNFEKILVDRNGLPVKRFRSSIKPDDPEFVASIEALLKSSAGQPGN